MPPPPTLATAIDEILGAVYTAFQMEIKTGGLLEGVITLARGDQSPVENLELPALWYFPGAMGEPSASLSIREEWALPIGVAAVVWSDDSAGGSLQANTLAAMARGVLLNNETEGVHSLDYVRRVKSVRFEPCNPKLMNKNRNTYAALATVEVAFITQD